MQISAGIRQFLAAFVATFLALFLIIQLDILGHLAYAVERGRLQAMREQMPSAEVLAAKSLTGRRVAEIVAPAVVSIMARPVLLEDHLGGDARDASTEGIGSGFVIDAENGYIVTNAHVVQGFHQVTIRLADGRRGTASVLGRDNRSDLAVIQTPMTRLFALPFADSEGVGVGDEVFSVGSPFGLIGTFSKGIISSAHSRNVSAGDGLYEGLLQTDAVVNPGNSGGPLVNMRGEVVGVSTAIATRDGIFAGVGFAIPSNKVTSQLPSLIDGGPGFLGVYLEQTPEGSPVSGVVVEGIIPGTAADASGLNRGDIITEIDGRKLWDTRSFIDHISVLRPGEQVTLKVYRDDGHQTVTVVLGARPS